MFGRKFKSELYLFTGIHLLRKDWKREIYQKAIETLKQKKKITICFILQEAAGDLIPDVKKNLHRYFPEIYVQKPRTLKTQNNGLWFDIFDKQSRINVFTNALKTLK